VTARARTFENPGWNQRHIS